MNFIYSFTNPPKHVFLVHGEPEGQEILRQKIEETSECKVIIPEFCESYEIVEEEPVLVETTKQVEVYKNEFKRLDLIERIEELKENIADMENVIMQKNIDTQDTELKRLEERVKEIQKQIQDMSN